MKKTVHILLFMLLAFIITLLSSFTGSLYLQEFLDESLLEIIITLLGINIATSSFLVAKLDEIKQRTKLTFSKTAEAIKQLLTEQIALIVITIVIGLISDSKALYFEAFTLNYESSPLVAFNSIFLVNLLRTWILIYVIAILRDIGLLMFDISLANFDTNRDDKL